MRAAPSSFAPTAKRQSILKTGFLSSPGTSLASNGSVSPTPWGPAPPTHRRSLRLMPTWAQCTLMVWTSPSPLAITSRSTRPVSPSTTQGRGTWTPGLPRGPPFSMPPPRSPTFVAPSGGAQIFYMVRTRKSATLTSTWLAANLTRGTAMFMPAMQLEIRASTPLAPTTLSVCTATPRNDKEKSNQQSHGGGFYIQMI